MNVTDVNYVSLLKILSMCIQNYCPSSNDRFARVYVYVCVCVCGMCVSVCVCVCVRADSLRTKNPYTCIEPSLASKIPLIIIPVYPLPSPSPQISLHLPNSMKIPNLSICRTYCLFASPRTFVFAIDILQRGFRDGAVYG